MKSILVSLFILGWATNSHAYGPGTSGGGAGIFCPSVVKDQPAVQLLDIYEGKVFSRYTYTESKIPYLNQLDAIAEEFKFDFSLYQDFKRTVKEVLTAMTMLPPGVSVNMPFDLGREAVPYPTGCMISGIGYYEQSGKLVVSFDAFSQLSETQKAAFIAHEALYKLNRIFKGDQNEDTSSPTRKLIAHLFSDQKNSALISKLSRPMTWVNYPASGYYLQVDWSMVKGKEDKLAFRALYSPILIKGPAKKATLKMESTKKYVDGQIRCYVWVGSSLQAASMQPINNCSEYLLPSKNPVTKVEYKLPKNCAVIRLDLKNEDPNNSRVPFTLEFDDEPYINGVIKSEPQQYIHFALYSE